jgi:hypothetical protein
MTKRKRFIESAVWLAVAALVAYKSVELELGTFTSPEAGFMPFLAALVLAFLGLLIFFQKDSSPREGDHEVSLPLNVTPTALIIASLLVVFVVLLKTLGYLISSFLLMMFLFRLAGNRKWMTVLLNSFLAATLSYLLFGVLLKLDLPEGVLLGLLR